MTKARSYTSHTGSNKLIVGIVLSVITYWLFAQSLLNIAPSVQASLSISTGMLNIGISATALFSAIFIVLAGTCADSFGRVRITYVGIGLSIAGSAALVLAQGTVLFIAGRVLQGLSAACIMPATMALVKEYYHGRARQRALSFWSLGSWGGSGVCSFFGGEVASTIGWRWVFVASIASAVVSALLIKGTPESKALDTPAGNTSSASSRHFDYLGLVLFMVSMLALNIVVARGSELGWTSIPALVLIALTIVGIAAFIQVELQCANSFVDFSLFANRKFLGALISNFMLNAVAGTLIVINSYVQQARGLSSGQTGVLSLGYLVLVLCTIRIGEKILQRTGPKKPMLAGSVIAGAGIALMTCTFVEGTAYLALVALGYSLFGMGLGMYATPSTDTALSNVPYEKSGMASGIYKMASSLGGALGVAIAAAAYNGLALTAGLDAGARLGLGVNIVFCVLAFIAVAVLIPAGRLAAAGGYYAEHAAAVGSAAAAGEKAPSADCPAES